MIWRVASDIGGTFTDVAYIDANGGLVTAKVPSSPPDFGRAVVEGVSQLVDGAGLDLADLSEMVHGCTIATNAILEGKGARTALVTTDGFRDVLELRRIRVPRLYEPLYVKPKPLSPRNLRFEVRERIGADGDVVTPLDEDQVRAVAKKIAAAKAEAVAVCFLHSYKNPDHERRAGEILRAELPDCFITLSADILPQIREYERSSTSVVNAYVGPPVRRYLNGMEADLRAAGCGGRISVMQSSGGIVDAEAIKEKPAQIVECGPAAGVVGAAWLAKSLGLSNIITFDMGGTTAKGSMIENGGLIFAEDYEVGDSMSTAGAIAGGGGYALRLPVIDISEVGAGGGSYVWLDRGGAIKVGPESASAVPGPVCYNTGGTRPTVTDANVVLGFLNQESLAGGSVPIDAKLSHDVLQSAIAEPMGLDVKAAAHGVHQVANATMVRAIKAVTTYRGRDPRDFALVAFGGNGGVHGVGIAQSLDIRRVVVPPAAGVFSAVGLLLAEKSVTVLRAFSSDLARLDQAMADKVFDELRAEATRLLDIRQDRIDDRLQAEMRYVGQAFEITVDLKTARAIDLDPSILRARFDQEYEQRFGHSFGADKPVEIVTLKLVARDRAHKPLNTLSLAAMAPPETVRSVWFGTEFGRRETPVIGRGALTGEAQAGPLIVEEYEGTTVVPPDASASVDEISNIIIELGTSS
jgi:N-methylhydantoinase A